ncbi:MAG: antitoxin [Opitutales bacterium]
MSRLTFNKSRSQKLFLNGGSQAVRIPKEMKFETEEVLLHREGERLIIEPKALSVKALCAQMGKAIEWEGVSRDVETTPEDIF